MSATTLQLRYHPQAYQFVFAALRYTQERLQRGVARSFDEEEGSHISGPELLEGVRALAVQQFGLMTIPLFRYWGVGSTEDFGRIVFELVERGEMRKTDDDSLADFYAVYDFEDAFDREYDIEVQAAFRR